MARPLSNQLEIISRNPHKIVAFANLPLSFRSVVRVLGTFHIYCFEMVVPFHTARKLDESALFATFLSSAFYGRIIKIDTKKKGQTTALIGFDKNMF